MILEIMLVFCVIFCSIFLFCNFSRVKKFNSKELYLKLKVSFHFSCIQKKEQICTSCEVSEMSQGTLITSLGPIHCKVTINCAGLYGDIVDQLAGIDTFRY